MCQCRSGSAARSSIAPRTSQVTSKKSPHTQDLWAPRKLAIHLASPSRADGAALARRAVLGASSPHAAARCRGRAASHSHAAGSSCPRAHHAGSSRQSKARAQRGCSSPQQPPRDTAAQRVWAFFFPPKGSAAPAPSLLHTSSDATATRHRQLISRSGRQSTALAAGLIHTTLGRATPQIPNLGTKSPLALHLLSPAPCGLSWGARGSGTSL